MAAMAQTTRTRRYLLVAIALMATMASPLGSGRAGGQEPPVEVTVTGTSGSETFLHRCFEDPEVDVHPATVTVHRSGNLAAPLAVNVGYRNATAPLPNPVTIDAGSAATTIAIEAVPSDGRQVGIEVLAGDGYTVGSPAAASVGIATIIGDPTCAFDLNVERWVEVGATPDQVNVASRFDVPLDELTYQTRGTEPPGLTFQRDGSWTGAASGPGRYQFSTRYCRQDRCASGPTVTVLVFAASGVTAGPNAPPSDPIPGRATPALPVTANAAYTG